MFDWVVGVIVAGGLLGVAFLMFAENIVPPIPSELVMPLAGFAAAQGQMSLPGVIAAGSVGALAGACAWYELGRRTPEEKLRAFIARHGRWLTLCEEDLDRSQAFFRRRGGPAVLVGRLVPGVRTFISVPAGLMRMPAAAFLGWSLLGTTAWTALLAGLGYVLASQYRRVETWLDPVSWAALAAVACLYVWRVIRMRRRASTPAR